MPARWGRRRPDAEGAAAGAYIQGFSTRSVDALAEALGLKGISKDQVSRICKETRGGLRRVVPQALAHVLKTLTVSITALHEYAAGHGSDTNARLRGTNAGPER